ncbi:efflux transporter, RND family, MFP subunit [Syntrophobotulus glycolicus DSM 8271]|uniref:Efflux transporter, RND family, MFP subunit n=1 Tax=Syntrophobotulus glycolicus (strain DSM 8271 / FlGlyR) TaxID=645991 RepID=F0SWN1_SYNGF|nr:efflux RND transporter periplasmic adaptor subunit [Syntrophobotulus glycolicus]ADY56871.1 efflux transporter, RND family, MFP subunit [Syntrophobotulus glycolicus DSM 8271]
MDKKKKRIIIAAVVIILLALIGLKVVKAMGDKAAKLAEEQNRQTYTPVEVLTVKAQDIASNVLLSGKVQADKEAPVLAKTPGKVTAVYGKVGDYVRKDQVLFSLDKTDVTRAYNQAAATLQMAEANYRTSMDNYENSRKNVERMKELYAAGAISKVELDQAELAASDAVKAAIESQLAQAKAGYDTVEQTMSDMDVKAPIDGILTSFDVSIGTMATSAAPSASVVDLNRVYVEVSISEKEINQIKNGQEAEVSIPSASLKTGGKIEELSVAADARGKYSLKVYLSNGERKIKPGMFANVTLSVASKSNVLVIPTDAVVFHEEKNVVYLVKDNLVTEKEVAVGLENGTQSEIVSGLAAGDVIVVKGQSLISDGAEIKVVTKDGQAVEGNAAGTAEPGKAGGGAQQ